MTMFSSGRRAALTTDPEPFERTYNGYDSKRISAHYAAMTPRRYENGFGEIVVTRFDPRPKYPSRHLTNPENRILAEYREQVEQGIPFTDPESWLANLDAMEAGSDAWRWRDFPDELEHAGRVLSRLAARQAVTTSIPERRRTQ